MGFMSGGQMAAKGVRRYFSMAKRFVFSEVLHCGQSYWMSNKLKSPFICGPSEAFNWGCNFLKFILQRCYNSKVLYYTSRVHSSHYYNDVFN